MQLSWADVVENTRTYRDSLRFPDTRPIAGCETASWAVSSGRRNAVFVG